MIGTEEAWALDRAARDARGRRRRRVGRRDRLRLRAPRHRGAAVRGARPRAADRGRRHLQGRRARLQEAGHRRSTPATLGRERAGRRRQRHVHLRRRAAARPTTSSSPPAAAPDVEGLGLDEAGVELDEHGLIKVDGALRTSRRGVYAIGDLVHGPALAHKASDEGIIAVEDAAGLETHPIAYIDIPRATFCTPNVGSLRADRGAGARAGLRRRRRQGPVRRRRRRHRLRRPQRHDQDRRRQAVRRAARRPHRRRAARPS